MSVATIDKWMVAAGLWVLLAFVAGLVYVANTVTHDGLGFFVVAGFVGLAAFGYLLRRRNGEPDLRQRRPGVEADFGAVASPPAR